MQESEHKKQRRRVETKRDKRTNVEVVTRGSYAHDGGSTIKMAATEAVAFTSRAATTALNQASFLEVEVQIAANGVFFHVLNQS